MLYLYSVLSSQKSYKVGWMVATCSEQCRKPIVGCEQRFEIRSPLPALLALLLWKHWVNTLVLWFPNFSEIGNPVSLVGVRVWNGSANQKWVEIGDTRYLEQWGGLPRGSALPPMYIMKPLGWINAVAAFHIRPLKVEWPVSSSGGSWPTSLGSTA